MDRKYNPIFSTNETVKNLVSNGIKQNGLEFSPNEIRDMFHMDAERFMRPVSGVGNERFRAMAAIGFVHGKQIFCFPWMSRLRFDAFHGHMTDLLDILENLKMVVIVPVGL